MSRNRIMCGSRVYCPGVSTSQIQPRGCLSLVRRNRSWIEGFTAAATSSRLFACVREPFSWDVRTPMDLLHPGSGVIRALEILKKDVEQTLHLLGCPAITESYIHRISTPTYFNKRSAARKNHPPRDLWPFKRAADREH
jgi:hypothetical protein